MGEQTYTILVLEVRADAVPAVLAAVPDGSVRTGGTFAGWARLAEFAGGRADPAPADAGDERGTA